ncbi:MAG: putative blue pigment (indigoidine) exporter [Haloarculaceae archaeon]
MALTYHRQYHHIGATVGRYRNFVLFLVLSAVWGTAFVAIKAGLAYFPPVLFAALRYDVAGLIMVVYAGVVTDAWLPNGRRQWAAVAVGAVLLIASYHAFLFVGEQGTTSAAAAIIVSLSPILTTVIARGFLPSERLAPAGLAGLVLGLVGVGLLVQPTPSRLAGGAMLSELLVFVAVLSFALGSVLTRWLDADIAIETMEAWAMLGGAALMHVASIAIGESPGAIAWTPRGVVALGYLALVASAAGFLIYFDLLDRLGPIEINLVSYAAPVFAALGGVALLGETIDSVTLAGFVLIVAGFAVLKRNALRATFTRER